MIPVIFFIICFIIIAKWLTSYDHKKTYHHRTGLYDVSFRRPPKQQYIEWKVKRCADKKIITGRHHSISYSDTINNIDLMKSCANIAIQDFLYKEKLQQFNKLKDIIEL